MNVQQDPHAVEELRHIGARQLPVVRKGERWVNGQSIYELAEFVGVQLARKMLAPRVLHRRVIMILEADSALCLRVPAADFHEVPPILFKLGRMRSYANLSCHIGQVAETFLNLVENGTRLIADHLDAPLPPGVHTPADASAFVDRVAARYKSWWPVGGPSMDYGADADVYYGTQTLHEFFERTVWHAAQHTRQLEAELLGVGLVPDRLLTAAHLEGLPIPEQVFD